MWCQQGIGSWNAIRSRQARKIEASRWATASRWAHRASGSQQARNRNEVWGARRCLWFEVVGRHEASVPAMATKQDKGLTQAARTKQAMHDGQVRPATTYWIVAAGNRCRYII